MTKRTRAKRDTWTLLSWNVNGIRAAEKKGFLDWLSGSGADVIAVQETKARPEQLSAGLLQPPGYAAAWWNNNTVVLVTQSPGGTLQDELLAAYLKLP